MLPCHASDTNVVTPMAPFNLIARFVNVEQSPYCFFWLLLLDLVGFDCMDLPPSFVSSWIMVCPIEHSVFQLPLTSSTLYMDVYFLVLFPIHSTHIQVSSLNYH